MAVVLAESLYAEESVQLSALLLAMHHIELVVADRQLLVGVNSPLVCQHRIRAVHRLRRVDVRRALVDRVLCSVLSRDNEHIVLIMRPVTGNEPEFSVVDDRCGNLKVSVAGMDASPVGDQGLIDFPSVRQPVGHARSRLIEHKEIQLRTELLVVALHGLANQVKMCLELGFIRKCIHVDPLQGIAVRIPSPVSAGGGFHLEGSREELPGVRDMRSAAEIHEILARVIDRDWLIFRKILDQLFLELLIRKELESFLF